MISFSTKLKNQLLTSIAAGPSLPAATAALGNGIIRIKTGSQPANANAAETGITLGQVTVAAGAFTHGVTTNGLTFATAANATLTKTLAQLWQFTGLAAGTCGWFRFVGNAADDGSEDTGIIYPRIDGRIALSGGEMTPSSMTVVVGALVSIDAFSIDLLSWP